MQRPAKWVLSALTRLDASSLGEVPPIENSGPFGNTLPGSLKLRVPLGKGLVEALLSKALSDLPELKAHRPRHEFEGVRRVE